MEKKLLIIDDDHLVCVSLSRVLKKLDYVVEFCTDAHQSESYIKEFYPDVILLDIYLTNMDGLALLKIFRKKFREIPVIMITGYSDVKIAVTAMKSGAYDFLLKPIDLDQLKSVLTKVFEYQSLQFQVNKLNSLYQTDELTRDFFGKSNKINKLLNLVERLSHSADTTILIEGESGTGKEGIAKYIHQQSPRKQCNFVQINCSAIPKELAESELFGHERGAFTGASQKTKLGKFEIAEGGTILLDEIGDLSLDLQAKLLRVLQEKSFYRVGGEKEVKVNVRILAATNKDLEKEVEKGNFREDLFYRLNVAKVYLPPLRERKEDIPYLAYLFLKEFNSKLTCPINEISSDFLKSLNEYSWKGNIRELRNVIERATLLCEGDILTDENFNTVQETSAHPKHNTNFQISIPPKGIKMDIVVKDLINKTLQITAGNQLKAAKVLGISRAKLRYRMEQLGIEVIKKIE